MKRILIVIMPLFLSACGIFPTNNRLIDPEEKLSKPIVEKTSHQRIKPLDLNQATKVKYGLELPGKSYKDFEQTQVNGPMQFIISNIRLTPFYPRSSMSEVFGGRELVKVTFHIAVENISTDRKGFTFPNHGYFLTENDKRIHQPIVLNDYLDGSYEDPDISGDFEPGDYKEADLTYYLPGTMEEHLQLHFILENSDKMDVIPIEEVHFWMDLE